MFWSKLGIRDVPIDSCAMPPAALRMAKLIQCAWQSSGQAVTALGTVCGDVSVVIFDQSSLLCAPILLSNICCQILFWEDS